ncbi:unnamed protein product, partial [Allacma fusca]
PNKRREAPFIQRIPKYEFLGSTTLDLNEVLQHLHGFSKIIEPPFSNYSKQKFNRKMEMPLLRFHSCKHLNKIPNESKDNISKASQLTPVTEFIRGMIQKPMVRLFSGENLTGDFEDYHFGKDNKLKGCYLLKKIRKVKSAATLGKCIRLFEEE